MTVQEACNPLAGLSSRSLLLKGGRWNMTRLHRVPTRIFKLPRRIRKFKPTSKGLLNLALKLVTKFCSVQ